MYRAAQKTEIACVAKKAVDRLFEGLPQTTTNMKTKLLLFILLIGSATSQATPIPGRLVIDGTLTLNSPNPALATEVISWNSARLNRAATGAFARTVSGVDTSNLTAAWIFDPSTPIIPFLQIGGFTFNLESVVDLGRFNLPSLKGFSLQATGDVTAAGFETTPVSISFSASRELSQSHFQKNVHFYLTIGNGIVPESGTTVGLLGLALGGVELLRRGTKRADSR